MSLEPKPKDSALDHSPEKFKIHLCSVKAKILNQVLSEKQIITESLVHYCTGYLHSA